MKEMWVESSPCQRYWRIEGTKRLLHHAVHNAFKLALRALVPRVGED